MNAPQLDREDYKNGNGCAKWWTKDGLWHVARPATDCFGKPDLLWTDEEYETREEAVAALETPLA